MWKRDEMCSALLLVGCISEPDGRKEEWTKLETQTIFLGSILLIMSTLLGFMHAMLVKATFLKSDVCLMYEAGMVIRRWNVLPSSPMVEVAPSAFDSSLDEPYYRYLCITIYISITRELVHMFKNQSSLSCPVLWNERACVPKTWVGDK